MLWLGHSCKSSPDTYTETIVVTDTITDTISQVVTEKVLVTKTFIKPIKDTITLPGITVYRDTDSLHLSLQKSQKMYRKDSIYQAWVSGVDPSLDSIKVYNKTITTYIKQKPDKLFLEAGSFYSDKFNGFITCNYNVFSNITAFGGYVAGMNTPVLGVKYKVKFK